MKFTLVKSLVGTWWGEQELYSSKSEENQGKPV